VGRSARASAARALIADDVATTGGSIMKAVEAARAALVLVDREEAAEFRRTTSNRGGNALYGRVCSSMRPAPPIGPAGTAMSRLIQPIRRTLKGLNDPRSTGAAPPIRAPEVLASRGTFKGRA